VRDRDRRSNRDDEVGIPIAVTPYVPVALIESIELTEGGTVTIQSDRPVESYTSGWDQATASYQIRLSRSRLARGVGSPTVDRRGAALRVQVRQATEEVIISIQPAPGVRIGELTQANQTLSLALVGRAQRQFLPGDRAATRVFPPLNQLPNVANQRVSIAIDPGHGGRDPGAVGIGGLRETDIVLDVSLQLATLLREHGAEVVLTRQDEREIDLEPRVLTANRANADLFVSIHANAISMSRPDVNGVETYFYGSPAGRELSDVILQSILEAADMRNRGVKEARFYVLRRTAMPATLVEVGFVTGAEDAPRLADPEFRTLIAQAIARGILQYVVETF
jgi:N-acetylmuramoyl-L-alanine amidase